MFAVELEFQIAAADGELVMFTWEDSQSLCLGEVRLCVCVCVWGGGHLSCPGHRVIILTRCETRVFSFFEKNAQNAKRTFEMLK